MPVFRSGIRGVNLSPQHLALRSAAQWHARLGAVPECQVTQQQWQEWLQRDPLHPWAWQRVEQLQSELLGVSGELARHTLGKDAGLASRRVLLRALVLGIGAGGLAWGGYQRSPVWLADLRTGTGERRLHVLEDGTRLTLNTASAVDIRYDAGQRLILLRGGEILVQTADDPRPLSVRSPHGQMRALGTRFNVRLFEDHTQLLVLEHAVAVSNAASAEPLRVNAGMGLAFDNGPLPAPASADSSQSDWSKGHLVVDNWRLDRTLAELERYRSGFIRCSDNIAGLRVSGVYPLDDIDRTLALISQALNIRMETRTRFWVRLSSAV